MPHSPARAWRQSKSLVAGCAPHSPAGSPSARYRDIRGARRNKTSVMLSGDSTMAPRDFLTRPLRREPSNVP